MHLETNSHDSKIDFSEALKIITPPNPLSLVLSLFLGSHKAGRWALLGLWVDRLSLLTWVAGWARLSSPWVETEQNLCLAGSRDTEAKLNHPSLNIAMVQLYISRTRICLPLPPHSVSHFAKCIDCNPSNFVKTPLVPGVRGFLNPALEP